VKIAILNSKASVFRVRVIGILAIVLVALFGCASQPSPVDLDGQGLSSATQPPSYEYVLGPGDVLDIFIWRNPDLNSTAVPIRPDGNISAPLVDEIAAAGKTPKALAREIEQKLTHFIKNPYVTVIVRQFSGALKDQVRVVGEAATPRALPYRTRLTLLDVMISVGGLTEFAAGNRAKVVRVTDKGEVQIPVRLADLLRDGDISANIPMTPGDIVIIPESWF
jgi:polysaccharide export outer membrane protein